jgi:hypothetical protein
MVVARRIGIAQDTMTTKESSAATLTSVEAALA